VFNVAAINMAVIAVAVIAEPAIAVRGLIPPVLCIDVRIQGISTPQPFR
jgi:hypothetical protein